MRQIGQETGTLSESGAGAASLSQALRKANRIDRDAVHQVFPDIFCSRRPRLDDEAHYHGVAAAQNSSDIEFAWRLAKRVTCAGAEKLVDAVRPDEVLRQPKAPILR